VIQQEALELRAAKVQDVELARDGDVGDGWLPEQDRHLAEEVALGEASNLVAIDLDRDLAVEDHVEPVPVKPWRRMR
jgi:hypothetical protein